MVFSSVYILHRYSEFRLFERHSRIPCLPLFTVVHWGNYHVTVKSTRNASPSLSLLSPKVQLVLARSTTKGIFSCAARLTHPLVVPDLLS